MTPSKLIKHAEMNTVYADGSTPTSGVCMVRLDSASRELKIYYVDENGEEVFYVGPELGLGHWKLQCPANGGIASLHAFDGSDIFEGSWIESRREGMWRITVEDDDETE
ncbi:MAG: hypothetical protein Q8R97_10025 [Brevundimonas sp.]|nr:hypothetical protein [Brevundimonas sp.]